MEKMGESGNGIYERYILLKVKNNFKG